MSYFYSPGTGGFYTREVHGEAVPADAVEVAADRHRELMIAQNNGATIVAGPSGHPQARKPGISERRKRAINQVRAEARRRIRSVSPEWRQMNDLRAPSPAGHARFAAIDAIRAASDTLENAIAKASADDLAKLVVADRAEWPSTREN